MNNAAITKLVNMDEVFLNFYPKDQYLIAPVNVKRVGCNRGEDEKKGCTLALACEMFSENLWPHF